MGTDDKDFRLAGDFVVLPRWLFDEVLVVGELPAPYLRIVLFLLRKTVGWGKRQDHISLTQIERGANVYRRYAQAGLRFWTEVGVIQVEASGKRRMNRITLTDLSGDEIGRRIRAWVNQRRCDRLVPTGN